MASKEQAKLRFVTWNIPGIKNPKKRSKVFSSLRDLLADIVFMQETHIGEKDQNTFQNLENWKVYFTVHNSRSKGVAILIRNDVPFEYICHDEDCSGGYIVLFCHLYGELYTLVNVYNHKEDSIVLGRLKQYLMATAEGVLVVGGDFNTVLNPCFDRIPSSSRQSPFRSILEDFTVSLNLRDTWSYQASRADIADCAEEGFTRSQNESRSRIDMFFLPEDKMERVSEIRVEKSLKDISDHYPLVLQLRIKKQTENKIPNIATQLTQFMNNRKSGEISGAEIVNAIMSLTDLEEPDRLGVNHCKAEYRLVIASLKIKYNSIIKDKKLPEGFQMSNSSGDRQIFNVDYLIFSHILAKRLRMFFTPSLKRKVEANLKITLKLSFETGNQQIRWPFLNEVITQLKPIPSAPPPDFSIMDCILPKVQSSDELRCLHPGDPLTNTILNLALNQLKDKVFDFEKKCENVRHQSNKKHKRKCKEIRSMATICYHRQSLLIYTWSEVQKRDVKNKVDSFEEESGLKLRKKE